MNAGQPMPSGASQSANGEVWSALTALFGESIPAPAVGSVAAVPGHKTLSGAPTILQRNAISSVLAGIEVPDESAEVDNMAAAIPVAPAATAGIHLLKRAAVPPITLPADSLPLAAPGTAIAS